MSDHVVIAMALDPTVIALVGTVFGGVGLKIVEYWLGKNRVRVDDATKIREELRADMAAQKAEIAQLEASLDKWKEQYYALFEKYIKLQTELTLALEGIKKDASKETNVVQDLQTEPPPTPPVIETKGVV
jgi:hypothetical protein